MNNTTVDPLIGRTVSQYEIVARIGGGGMGVVYKATDLKLGRPVALKFLPSQWSHDEGAKQRFLREAQAASATNHRNICVIHDIGETADGQLFIVMAYYEGQTLKQRLEGGLLPVAEAVEIAAEVAEGLAKAHAQGVVHRDVKPGNLMVTDDGVKVLDFGLAKFADALQLTIPGSTVGTVSYMSPEQVRGEEADARSDVWALGIVLYEMLTGRVPFSGAYPEATFHAIKNEPVPAMSVPPDRDIVPALESLVRRALEKNTDQRYQTTRELARDLRLLQGRTVPVDLLTGQLPPLPLMRPPEALSWRQRVRRAVAPARAIAAIVAIAAVAAGVYGWFTRPIVRIPVAIAPVANHTGEPELDNYRMALTAALIDELSESPNIRVVSYRRLLEVVRKFMSSGDVSSTEAIQAIATGAGASIVVVPSLEYRNGMWLAQAQVRNVERGTVTETLETESLASSLPKETALRQMPLLATRLQTLFKTTGPGRSYRSRPESARFRSLDLARAFEEGVDAFEHLEYAAARQAFERARQLDESHAMTHAWLGRVLLALGDKSQAVASATRAKQLTLPDTPELEVRFVEAVLSETQGDVMAAERHYRELARQNGGDAILQSELADFLKRQNQDQAAIDAYREALRLDGQSNRPSVDLCQLYVRQNEYPLAEQEARTALKKFQSSGDKGGEAQALLCLVDAQRMQGGESRLDDARRNVESARAIFESLGYQYGLSRVYQYFGLVETGVRDYSAAARFFEEALARSRVVGNQLIEGNALMNLGVAFELLGQRSKVLKYYEEARDFFERRGDAWRAAEQEANVATLLVDYGTEQQVALRRLRNARATFEKLGNVEFQVIALEAEGASALHAGRHEEARRQLTAALSLAKERQLGNRMIFVSIRLAESYFATSDYEKARVLLEEMAATPAGRNELALPLALGRVYTKLGDLQGARTRLGRTLADVQATNQLWLAPAAYAALGELEAEAGNPQEALANFAKASAYWTDDLPHAASVEARCRVASLESAHRRVPPAEFAASIEQARKMGRLYAEAICRLEQARVYLSQRQYPEAIATLQQLPREGDQTIGKELRAEECYSLAAAMSARGDPSGAIEQVMSAGKLVQELLAALPERFRDGFASRPMIRQIIAAYAERKQS